jgi:hypothetical protein
MNNDKLSRWAAIAEMIAATGVILSLIFVGLQINDESRETRAATLQATNDSEMFMQSQLLRYAEVWEKILSGAPLEDGTEERRGIVLYNLVMTEYENRYAQFEAGYFDPVLWESRRVGLARFASVPFYEIWSESIGASDHSPSFLEIIEDMRRSQP